MCLFWCVELVNEYLLKMLRIDWMEFIIEAEAEAKIQEFSSIFKSDEWTKFNWLNYHNDDNYPEESLSWCAK